MSVWGDSQSSTHFLFFLAGNLGPIFFLACLGLWACWKAGARFGFICVGLLVGAYAAWGANAILLSLGQARQSDEIYFFLVVMMAVLASFGRVELLRRIVECSRASSPTRFTWTWPRTLSAVLVLWFPLTLPWWWHPEEMDPHFRLSLDPILERLTTLAAWIRENTNDDVFFAGVDIAVWIPALTGRRVGRYPGANSSENSSTCTSPFKVNISLHGLSLQNVNPKMDRHLAIPEFAPSGHRATVHSTDIT
jgi:hypothetical protein